MGFLSKATGLLGGGSSSSGSSQSGFMTLPPELQQPFKDYAPLLNQYLNPTNPDNVARFNPLGQTAGETAAYSNINKGFAATPDSLKADIAMQMNPFDEYVINDINRQSQGDYSILKQNLSETGQMGSNRAILGASDVEQNRLNNIGKFRQDQYNTALDNSLNELTQSRAADATMQLGVGDRQRALDLQTKQAPIAALQSFGTLLGALPKDGGSTSTQKSSSSSGLGDLISAGAQAYAASDIRLKKDIKKLGTKNGFNLYSFRYLWSPIVYIGVMAQEIKKVLPEAVKVMENGYYAVDYNKLGFKMEAA